MPDERIPFLDDALASEGAAGSESPAVAANKGAVTLNPSDPGLPARDVVAELVPAEDPTFQSLGLPTIEGHAVTLPEWRGFEAYCRTEGRVGEMIAAAAQAAGVAEGTVSDWRRRPWWNGLFEIFVEGEQQAFHAALVQRRQKAVAFVDGVFEGTLTETQARAANAGMAAVQLLTKVGKRPLQDTRNLTQVNNTTVNNPGAAAPTARKLEHVTDADLMDYLTSGKALPE